MSIIFELADQLWALKEKKKELELALKELSAQLEQVSDELSGEMLAVEMANFVRRGQMYYLTTRIFASTPQERREELIKWLKAHDHGELVQESVHPSTLGAFVRDLLEEGLLPRELGELVSVNQKTLVAIRKAK